MSDLREQITEVIKRVDCLPSGETDPYEDMADAVIGTLGLRQRKINGPNGKKLRCYVTRWELVDD